MLKNLWGPQLSEAKPLEKQRFSKENGGWQEMGEGSGATEPHPIKGLGGGRVGAKRCFARAGGGRETEMLKNL